MTFAECARDSWLDVTKIYSDNPTSVAYALMNYNSLIREFSGVNPHHEEYEDGKLIQYDHLERIS